MMEEREQQLPCLTGLGLQSPSSVQKHNRPHLGDGERLTCCPVSAFQLMEGSLFIAAMSVGVGSRPNQRNNASPQWDQKEFSNRVKTKAALQKHSILFDP